MMYEFKPEFNNCVIKFRKWDSVVRFCQKNNVSPESITFVYSIKEKLANKKAEAKAAVAHAQFLESQKIENDRELTRRSIIDSARVAALDDFLMKKYDLTNGKLNFYKYGLRLSTNGDSETYIELDKYINDILNNMSTAEQAA